eukprot:gene10747-16553_t
MPHPVGYRLIWQCKAANGDLFVWKPVPPSDKFVAAGMEPPLDEVRCYPSEWSIKAVGHPMWEEANVGAPVKLVVGTGIGTMNFETGGHRGDFREIRPGKWYADFEGTEVDDTAKEEAVPFDIIAARLPRTEERDGNTYYIVEVTASDSRTWQVQKRYDRFLELRIRCKDKGHDTPHSFPAKSLLKVSGKERDERRKACDWYITEMVDKARQPWGCTLRPILNEFLQLMAAG